MSSGKAVVIILNTLHSFGGLTLMNWSKNMSTTTLLPFQPQYYKSTIGHDGFVMEAMTNMWEESLQQICFLCSLATRAKRAAPHKLPYITTS